MPKRESSQNHFWTRCWEKFVPGIPKPSKMDGVVHLIAVSYTHLDVYKRQVYQCLQHCPLLPGMVVWEFVKIPVRLVYNGTMKCRVRTEWRTQLLPPSTSAGGACSWRACSLQCWPSNVVWGDQSILICTESALRYTGMQVDQWIGGAKAWLLILFNMMYWTS